MESGEGTGSAGGVVGACEGESFGTGTNERGETWDDGP